MDYIVHGVANRWRQLSYFHTYAYIYIYIHMHIYRFPRRLRWYRICLQCRRPEFNSWVGTIPWRRAWQHTPVFLPGESPWTEEPGGLTPWALAWESVAREACLLFHLRTNFTGEYAHMCTHTHTHTFIKTHIYIHTHIHTCMKKVKC